MITRAAPNPGRILNFTTMIDPAKSINEIQSILAAHGAKRFSILFDENRTAEGIEFVLNIGDSERHFEMKSNWRAVRTKLIAAHNKGKKTYDRGYWEDHPQQYTRNTVPATVDDQAKRTAWRILKDAIEVMVNLDTAGIADTAQVFFGFGVLESGSTIYDLYLETHKALPAS